MEYQFDELTIRKTSGGKILLHYKNSKEESKIYLKRSSIAKIIEVFKKMLQ